MNSTNEEAVLVFDLHFKLITKPNGIIAFLNQFENAEINQSEFYGKVKFQTIIDILNHNKQLIGKEEAFQKELDGMFGEIKIEICRRLKLLLTFEKLSDNFKEDWKKIRVFNSLIIDLKQQGLFDMVIKLMDENKINLGNRLAFEEKYKPFTPNLNGKNGKNHIKSTLSTKLPEAHSKFDIWLSPLEYEKAFKDRKHESAQIPVTELSDDLIYEKIIPKIIDRYCLDFNVKKKGSDEFMEVFNLKNYFLNNSND